MGTFKELAGLNPSPTQTRLDATAATRTDTEFERETVTSATDAPTD
jgi:hypothetical protein